MVNFLFARCTWSLAASPRVGGECVQAARRRAKRVGAVVRRLGLCLPWASQVHIELEYGLVRLECQYERKKESSTKLTRAIIN